MYIAKHFELDPQRAAQLIANAETVQLVTAHETGPVATILPVVHRSDDGYGSLVFHLTRTNSQWKDPGLGQALAIVSGSDSYIDPLWYPSHAETPSVPTWDYVTVHAYGQLVVHDDPVWTRSAVEELSARHGHELTIDNDALARLLRAIVGVELRIERIEAKAKLSQNRRPDDVRGVIAGLHESGQHQLADEVAEIALPHSQARQELIEQVRSQGKRQYT